MEFSYSVFDPSLVPDGGFIANNCSPKPILQPGIYFLLDGGAIVYVGQSVDCDTRVKKHIIDGEKKFDSYYVFKCPLEYLDLYEAHCLWKFQPKYNIHLPIQPFVTVFGAYIKKNGIKLATKQARRIAEHCKSRRFWAVKELDSLFNLKTV